MLRIVTTILFFVFFSIASNAFAKESYSIDTQVKSETTSTADDGGHHTGKNNDDHHEMVSPSVFLCIPFVALLLLIAIGPLFFEHFWHKNYPIIAVALASIVVLYYVFVLGNINGPLHALQEYVPFISLLAALYIASGGIGIKINQEVSPLVNILLLFTGALISNLIGTTGASMLLIRPFIRLNRTRIKAYHIIFFIFIVSNVGGSLTPIGDPPLFLGFLKGIPFFWTLENNLLPWALAIILLLIIFYFFDSRNKSVYDLEEEPEIPSSKKISIEGSRNFIWLLVVILAVFIDPNVDGMEWVPSIHHHGSKISFIKEIIWLSVAFFSFKFARKEALKINEFNFEPIREVAFIFIGIFGTMTPALQLVGNFAKSPEGQNLISPNTLYWGTGMLSGFLDNAPTYVNFLTAAISAKGGNISSIESVRAFAAGDFEGSVILLKSISVAAVFFGAMTYIGNGPNFMVKSISEQIGIKMPSFFGYIVRFSLPVLLPILIITWLVFF